MPEQTLLDLEVLDDRLDHQLAIHQGLQAIDHLQMLQRLGGRLRGDPRLLLQLGEGRRQLLSRRARRTFASIEQQDVQPGLGHDLGDALPHGARPDDTDALQCVWVHRPMYSGWRFCRKACMPSF
ncbi:hypothetical protein D3C86_1562440 [compost metagenome]